MKSWSVKFTKTRFRWTDTIKTSQLQIKLVRFYEISSVLFIYNTITNVDKKKKKYTIMSG